MLHFKPFLFALFALLSATPALATKVPTPPESASDTVARRFFTEDPDAPRFAPPGYNFTIVEYMDYQCPYCRAARATLKQLTARDRKVRIIFRDIPVFGPASERAARVAIAAKYQNRYLAVHDALLQAARPLDESKIEAATKKAGADWGQLEADLKLHSNDIEDLIARNMEQSEMLGFKGTPGFIFGSSLGFGTVKLEVIERVIREARAKAAGSRSANTRKPRAKR